MRIVVTVILAAASLILPASVGVAQLAAKKVLTLEIGRKIVAAAEAEAARKRIAGVVAVVDDEGWVIVIERMDHAAYLASVVGGVGASFDTPEHDVQIAQAGLKALDH